MNVDMQKNGALPFYFIPHPSSLPTAVYFLLHFPFPQRGASGRVRDEDGGRYPPSRPMEPGLSSSWPKPAATIRPARGKIHCTESPQCLLEFPDFRGAEIPVC